MPYSGTSNSAVVSIADSTSWDALVPDRLKRPTSGDSPQVIRVYLIDNDGNPEDPVNNEVMILLEDAAGTAITTRTFQDSGSA